ncbi:mis18-binding protein 1 isoform X2 [Halichoeres trimaculatus]|uniref:mis18-binding protein 1 isoform X2 n=1 Tax=Halichoeres trimaculatus TaxID=147232 RepID=UPI003D9DB591
MASYHFSTQHAKPRVETPAKIFAKLKSKVQREEISERSLNNAAIEPLYTEHHAACLMPPKLRPGSTHVNDDFKENQMFGPYRNEAQVLTLSPIPSPHKPCRDSYLDIGRKPWSECSPRKGVFMESTAMSPPLSLYNGTTPIHSEPPQIGHLDEFMVTSSRTPVKMRPEERECRSVVKGDIARFDKLKSSASMYSPMRKRLRKTTLELQDSNTLGSCTNKVGDGVFRKPQERKASNAFSGDDSDNNTALEVLREVRGYPGDRPGMNQFPHEPMLPPTSPAIKRCKIDVEKLPLSPAKMFAYMKQRESKVEQQDVHGVSSTTRDLFDDGDSHLSRDTHPSTTHSVIQALRDPPGNVSPVERSPEKSADSQSDTDPSGNVQILDEQSHPVLFEDSLVLNTPRIAIPKNLSAVFKRNKNPLVSKFPSERVVYLKKWFLKKNLKGLYVEGIHRDDNIPWHSNIIVERVSSSVLKTVSGRVYILVGKMNLKVDSEFPNWLLKKFVSGFPVNWKSLYESLSEKTDTDKDDKGKTAKSKSKSGASSVSHSKQQHKQKPRRIPASCPPAPLHFVSRSGRTIKPPLEYWRGGRVILDAQMNVSIHECYETTICIPEVKVSTRKPKNPARVMLSSDEGHDGCGSTTDQDEPATLRQVKPQLRRSNRAKVSSEGEPSPSLEPPEETHGSRGKGSCRATWSSRRNTATEKSLSTKQAEPEKSSKNSKRQTQKPPTPPLRVSRRRQAVSSSPESLPFTDNSQSSDDDVLSRRVKKEKAIHKTRSSRVVNKSSQSSRFLSSKSSEESPEDMKKRAKVTRTRGAAQTQRKPTESKSSKTSPATKPLPKATQPSKKEKAKKSNILTPQDEDGDEWTETELIRLQEAVSYFPKHIEGYWTKVARMVGTRSTEECHRQHMSQGHSHSPAKKPSKSRKQKVEAPKDPVTDQPLISARVGTLKRKQEVRQFLDAMPKKGVEDFFTSGYMQKKRSEIPSMSSADNNDFSLSELEPLTPGSTAFPEVKTPRCLHITPGMMHSPNMTNDDKYVFQLQKRMKKNQFNACKQASSSKSFTPTPSVKRTMRRCGDTDTFVVWEMFPGNDAAQPDSEEEEDFYFSDND